MTITQEQFDRMVPENGTLFVRYVRNSEIRLKSGVSILMPDWGRIEQSPHYGIVEKVCEKPLGYEIYSPSIEVKKGDLVYFDYKASNRIIRDAWNNLLVVDQGNGVSHAYMTIPYEYCYAKSYPTQKQKEEGFIHIDASETPIIPINGSILVHGLPIKFAPKHFPVMERYNLDLFRVKVIDFSRTQMSYRWKEWNMFANLDINPGDTLVIRPGSPRGIVNSSYFSLKHNYVNLLSLQPYMIMAIEKE